MSFTLVALAPFFAAFLAPFIFRFLKEYSSWALAIVPAAIFFFLASFIPAIVEQKLISAGFIWIGAFGIELNFFLDGLSLTFGLLISGIGTFIVLYSGAYLKGHPHQGRFFAFILMFMGSMLGLVMADNLIALFTFWELTSITSFLLIGFDHSREASRRAAIQALVVTGGGGLSLLAGFALLNLVTGHWNMIDMFQFGPALRESDFYLPILLFVLGGAFAKSAQFPLHFWLPNAMEAPTPVSAYLHSATMVKAGVYLLARMAPILGGTTLWGTILPIVGGITLLWGATFALKQTDLKQMLAQTTVASLGLMVMLIGIYNEAAIIGVVLYLLAHAFYKGAMFMISGGIDHSAGTRDITMLGGLMRKMPVTFVATILAAAGMAGLPLTIAFLAKEEMYGALLHADWMTLLAQPQDLLAVIVILVGNALMMAVGLAILFKVFLGPEKPTAEHAHENSFSFWIGPATLGVLAVLGGVMTDFINHNVVTPVASPIIFSDVEAHLHLGFDLIIKPAFILSLLTWVLGVLIYLAIGRIRVNLAAMVEAANISFDKIFDWLMFGLVRLSDAVTRLLHHGRLEIYLTLVFIMFAAVFFGPLFLMQVEWQPLQIPNLHFYEWSTIVIAIAGLFAVVAAQTRLQAIVSLGIQGFAVAILFLLFGAPDLSFTQFMVETLSVVILALVMTRLHLDQADNRVRADKLRDGSVALLGGVGVTALMLLVLQGTLDMRLTDLFAATSVAIAHGHNIVNVILVDYRGLDTLGEISVVMTAGIAILALIRIRTGGRQVGIGAPKAAKRGGGK
ncbi:MAG: putative monovalent cation/H+ antiporter subunit A [Hyphomicrobiaceae bacterium]|nr:putative monovalent cation/H+ antiporter subunit A [Hyphomicrobiaceae bacterium]MCC0023147.1 putative monovalent cation/H+ antiporter subunit A [Hyphomicrobiaceae bacterium]